MSGTPEGWRWPWAPWVFSAFYSSCDPFRYTDGSCYTRDGKKLIRHRTDNWHCNAVLAAR